MEIGIISDTHISKNHNFDKLINKVGTIFSDTELIIHAGDVSNEIFLGELENISKLEGVKGEDDDSSINNRFSDSKVLEIFSYRIGISHKFPSDDFLKENQINIMIYGHTHIPSIQEIPGVLILNPGSPTYPKSPIRKKSSILYPDRAALPTVIILNIEPDLSSAYLVSFKIA